MDAPNLVALAICVAAVLLAPRVLLTGVGHVSDGIAQLFVPPDRTLGWPRGVQESDDPWGWHDPVIASLTGDADSVVAFELLNDAVADVVDISGVEPTHPGGLVVPIGPVRS
jgi:hypothetical protein